MVRHTQSRHVGVSAFHQGDIVHVPFDPTVGHEPRKSRPALVVSNDEFNALSSLIVVAPITSNDNGFPMHVRIRQGGRVSGCICIEQIRSLDLLAREALIVGHLDAETMNTVLHLISLSF